MPLLSSLDLPNEKKLIIPEGKKTPTKEKKAGKTLRVKAKVKPQPIKRVHRKSTVSKT
jgi:hypothetical protein